METCQQNPLHKRLKRLPEIWIDHPLYFITTCVHDRRPILTHDAVGDILKREWRESVNRYGWSIGSFVIMPDHVHFFCRPCSDASSLSEFMRTWKQWTSKRIKRDLGLKGAVWQKGFFDHILRSNDSYSEKWNYVQHNPVRAGLVARVRDWKYQGHIHFP